MGEGQEEVGLVGGTHQAGQKLRDAARGMVSEAFVVVGIARACRQGGCEEVRRRRRYGMVTARR